MSHRIRALIYLLIFLGLLGYILSRMIQQGDRPGCGAFVFLFLFAAASFTSLIRAKAAEAGPPPEEPESRT